MINRSDFEHIERSKKPFAEFHRPELVHMNTPQIKDYLKIPKKPVVEKKSRDVAK